jgi:phosphonoacetate hydrolase
LIEVNGRAYRVDTPPIVGVCLDGTDPAYLEAAAACMPFLEEMKKRGACGLATSAIPSFTNPNNIAIATGVPSAINGICGNYYYDQQTGEEAMMNSPEFLRCPTLFAAVANAGRNVAVVTAKEKLRLLLGNGLKGICFSVEKAGPTVFAEQNIKALGALRDGKVPGIYDPEASIYCLEAGAGLLSHGLADFLYLSTTDFVQHKYAPGEPVAQKFYSDVDRILRQLDAAGATLAVTADHGMNAKTLPDGSPCVQFLEEQLHRAGFGDAVVILPITDPYVVHHGALGSYATIYLKGSDVNTVKAALEKTPGVELVLTREEARRRFDLPEDRIGDLVALGDQTTVLGRTPAWHDLSAVKENLRSHGGLHESRVPFLLNRPLLPEYAQKLAAGQVRNYDLYDFALNGVRS